MTKNKEFLVGLCMVLVLIITIHVALFSKYENARDIFCNTEGITTTRSLQWFGPVLLIGVRALPGAT